MYGNFMIVKVIWQGRVCVKVFSYLVSGSNESCVRVV